MVPFMIRASVYDHAGNLLILDASGDIRGNVHYEQAYSATSFLGGCGAGQLNLGLTYEDVFARGYWAARNIVELSVAEDTLQAPVSTSDLPTGAVAKLYVSSLIPYTSLEPDEQMVWLYDDVTLTMRIPVVSTGTDGTGNYIAVGAPLSGGGNPTTIAAYGAGTYLGRRRYTGAVIRRDLIKERALQQTIYLQGLNSRFAEAYGTFTVGSSESIDVGVALATWLLQFADRWPALTISATNFGTVGGAYAQGDWTTSSVADLIEDMCQQITTGDGWSMRVGHDRVVRFLKVYNSSSNTYTYNVTLPQRSVSMEASAIKSTDEDTSSLVNSIEILGVTDPTTNQPVGAIVQDAESIELYGQIDGQPVYNYAVNNATQSAQAGQAYLNQFAAPAAAPSFTVYCWDEEPGPNGLTQGDQVSDVTCVTITNLDGTNYGRNYVPDSELQLTSGPDAVWTDESSGAITVADGAGDSGSNAFEYTGTGAPSGSLYQGSAYFTVIPGNVYVLSVTISGTANVTSGNVKVALRSSSGPVYATLALTSDGRIEGTPWVCPAGVTSVQFIVHTNDATVADGDNIYWSHPQVDENQATAYEANYSAPKLYGLVQSAQTTIQYDQGWTQTVKIQAIEPDFNAAVEQQSNALAASLLKSQSPFSISSYCVSVEAYPSSAVPYSGLEVNAPEFLAIFAAGTDLQTIAATNVTVPASATSWLWLQSNGTYQVASTAAPVSGAILYAIVTSNATQIIGAIPKAAIGVMKMGVGNVNVAADLAAPTCTGVTVANTSTPTTLASDVAANLTVTNVPQDGSAYGLAYYFRQTGTTSWVPYGEETLPGLPNPAASITMPAFVYGQLQNGIAYDYAVGFVGIAGYGPLTTIASNVTATPIVVSTPYMIGTTSPTPTVSSVTVTNGTSANGITAAVNLQFTLTNQPTDGSLSRISIWYRAHSSTTWSTPSQGSFYTSIGVPGLPNPSASQIYNITLADIANGQNLDFAVTYENAQGADSANVGIIYSNWEALALNLPASALPSVPGGTSITATGAVTGYTGAGGGAYYAAFQVTPDVTSSPAFAQWGIGFAILAKVNNSGAIGTDTTLSDYQLVGQIPTTSNDTSLTGTTAALGAGNAYQLAVAPIAQNGSYGPLYSFALTTNQNLGSSSIGSIGNGNMIVDSDLNCTNFNTSGIGSLPQYWATEWMDGSSFLIAKVGTTTTEDAAAATANVIEVFHGDGGSGSTPRYCQLLSEAISVQPGVTYYFSYWMGTLSCSGNAPYWAIVPTTWSLAAGTGTTEYTLAATNGQPGQVYSGSWTCPSGVTQVCVLFNSNKTSISTTGPMHTCAPMLSTAQGPYTSGPTTRQQVAAAAPTTDANSSSTGPVNTTDVAGTHMHGTMSSAVQSTINLEGNILNVEFAGAQLNSSGALTAVDGLTMNEQLQVANGSVVVIKANITGASASGSAIRGFYIGGNLSLNYYKIYWNNAGFYIAKVSGGTASLIATASSTPPFDTNPHSMELAITYNPASSGNYIEATIDGIYTVSVTDSSSPLDPSSILIQAFTGGSGGSMAQFQIKASGSTYGSAPAAIRGVINSSGQAPASTFLNTQGSLGVVGGIPSSLPYTSTTTSVTLNLPSVTLKRADQSTFTVSASSPPFTGLSASHTYYVIAGVDVATQAWTAQLASSAFSGSQMVTSSNEFAADGFIPIFQNAQVATPASGSGGGSGGGYTPQCPARWQLVETMERGFIRADEIRVGMHLPAVGALWVEVLEVDVHPAPIWRYTLEDERGQRESFDVNDTHAVKMESMEWLRVRDMKCGERAAGIRGSLTVIEARYLIDDYFIPLTVEGHEFLMGDAVVHNFATL